MLLEYQRRYAPLLALIPTKQWNSTQYFFNRRVNRPDSGGVTDGGARPIGNSTYEQAVFNIRLFQAVGSVTGFAQTVTRDLVGDLRQIELDGTVTSMMWTLENCLIWGHDGATVAGQYPISTGLDYLVSNYVPGSGSNAYVNAQDMAGATFLLKYLDELIDLVETNAAMPIGSNYMFVMSPRMNSSVGQLLTNQQRFMAQPTMTAAGLNIPTYRDIPIGKTSFLSPRSSQMGTVTSATATTTGTLAAATYLYQVSAVIARFGEIQASAEVSQATTGSTSTVTLTVAAPANMPDGASPILYKVYRTSGSTGTETLVGVVDAFDTTGVATTSIIDTGTNLLTNSSGNTGPAAYQGGNTGLKPRGLAGAVTEDIYLVPRDSNFMVRPYTRDMQILPLAPTVSSPDSLPFAVLTDTCLAVRAPKYVGRLSRLVSNI
ncbi:MAG: hypothetical protein ACRDPM_27625 [Solirubrobacteraceae bacterium]